MIIDRLTRRQHGRRGEASSGKPAAPVSPISSGASSPAAAAPEEVERIVYQSQLPYDKALRAFRQAVQSRGLRIPMEMDIAGQIRDELGIGLRPCHVLCVDCPYVLLQAAVWDGSGAAFLPVRVVLVSSGPGTSIRFAGPVGSGLPRGLRIPFSRFLGRLVSALEEIGTPHVLYPTAG